jgi:hypothetical protein
VIKGTIIVIFSFLQISGFQDTGLYAASIDDHSQNSVPAEQKDVPLVENGCRYVANCHQFLRSLKNPEKSQNFFPQGKSEIYPDLFSISRGASPLQHKYPYLLTMVLRI